MPKHDTHPTEDSAADGMRSDSSIEPVDEIASEESDLERLRADLDEARTKAEEYLRLAQRSQADFVNFRRRIDEERSQQAREAARAVVLQLLPILDDFERALASADPADLESSWGKGVALIERNLRGVLAAEGVERIEAQGTEFNPWEHEAVGYQPAVDADEGTVLHVVRPGYRQGDRVIRPAQVIVARRA